MMCQGTGKITSLCWGIVILEKNSPNYRGKGNKFLRINPDFELWWEEDMQSYSLSLDTTMEIDCHNRGVDRYI